MVKFGYGSTLTVGELRSALVGLADNIPVTIFLGDRFTQPEPQVVDSFMMMVKSTKLHQPSGISGMEFEITAGPEFNY